MAVYSGDSSFGGSTSPAFTQVIARAALTVVADNQTVAFGQPDPTLTYKASGFQLGDTAATVLTGALIRDPGEAVGSYTIRQGTLAANANYTISYIAGTLVIESHTKTTITASTASPIYGQSVTFTATLTATDPGSPIPSGPVTFSDGTTVLGTAALDTGGKAAFSTTAINAGSRTITAALLNNPCYDSSSASTTLWVDQAGTSTALAASSNVSALGQSVTFTATVRPMAPGGATPSGTVTFMDGTKNLGTGTLDSNGKASVTTAALTIGIHSITASYGGSGNFTVSSAVVTQTVGLIATTTAIIASPSPSASGRSVTFTATVSAGSTVPTGSVTFKDGNTTLATVTLANGTASYATSSLKAATHTITASYIATASLAASTASLTQVISATIPPTAATTTIALAASVDRAALGQSVTFTATVRALGSSGTPTGSVTFLDGTKTLKTVTLNAAGTASYATSSLTVASHTITAAYAWRLGLYDRQRRRDGSGDP